MGFVALGFIILAGAIGAIAGTPVGCAVLGIGCMCLGAIQEIERLMDKKVK